jgi:starch-binding outer membrane protein, SusD/RagB family
MTNTLRARGGRWSLPRIAALAAILTLPLAACNPDDLLDVPDPDVSRPGAVTGAAGLPAILNAARGDFQVAYSGTGGGTGFEGLVNMSGLFTDELFFTETFPTRVVVDRRRIENDDISNATMRDIFFTIQRARQTAETAIAGFEEFGPGEIGHSEALSLGGYAYVLLAEIYCAPLPFSTLNDDSELVPGPALSRDAMLDQAITYFTEAQTIAEDLGDSDFEFLARVGHARALVDKGTTNLAAAAALVGPVPTDFVYLVFHSDNADRQNNGIWEFNWNQGRWTQANSEAGEGLPFRNGDPRTPFVNLGVGFDGARALFGTLKYPDRDADVHLADGIEARLIEAEAQLTLGNTTASINTLNALRTTVPGLLPLTLQATAAAQQNQLFSERAFWLYLTAHRLGDLRRLVRQYGRLESTIFPSGTYTGRGGGTYGNQVAFPVPFEERNNPNFTPGSCDPTVA